MKKTVMLLIVIATLLCGTVFSFAGVSLISPTAAATISGDSLLISVKITEPATIRVSMDAQMQEGRGFEKDGSRKLEAITDVDAEKLSKLDSDDLISVPFMEPETVKDTRSLWFYSKRVSDVEPGLYKVTVETLNKSGKVTGVTSTLVFVNEKVEKASADSVTFDSNTGKGFQWLRNLIKNIFGN
ncbi:MAG: hypothetical protein E7223_07990 [Clostridiales bacterium]|nr:hypothetical protein [Clostridiales bacterium]MBQ3107141.1 hypothetical protein [Bacillota bacterium]